MVDTRPGPKLMLPSTLLDAITSTRCIAFIGSGASSGCYDAWWKLINSICADCGTLVRVDETSTTEQLLEAAEAAKLASLEDYYESLRVHFGRYPTHTNLLYRALVR